MSASQGAEPTRRGRGAAAARRRRDRRGRGLRGPLAHGPVPLQHTRGEAFDALVLDAIEDLQQHWHDALDGVDFAVELIPPPQQTQPGTEFDPDVLDDNGVALGRVYRHGLGDSSRPLVMLYRRPIEQRAPAGELRADLVFTVVAELLADLTGRSLEDIDFDE